MKSKNTSFFNLMLDQSLNLSYVSQDCPFFYNCLTKLGSLEHLDILCLTHDSSIMDFDLVTPSTAVVQRLYSSYKHAFYNYTEHFILYYLYKKVQIQEAFSMNDLISVVIPGGIGALKIEEE